MTARDRKTVRLDERGRTSLAGLVDPDCREYEGYRQEDGSIVLVPADWIHDRVRAGLARPVGSGAR